MAYADQKMSAGKIWSIVIVVLIHVVLGYALVTGLASNFVSKVQEELTVVDVEEPPPPPEEEPPPPPPPDQPIEPPPVVSPPPIVRAPTPPPPVFTQPTPPTNFNPIPIAPPPAPPSPPAPPAAPVATVSRAAGPQGNPREWITDADYPARAMRDEAEGTSAITWEINLQGRVENCRVTSSSGHAELDRAACAAITRRARYRPALDQAGNPIRSSQSRRVVWRVPEN